jgi:hypothetical protein
VNHPESRTSGAIAPSQSGVAITDNLPGLIYVSQDTLLPAAAAGVFASRGEALFWRDRACGIACVCMLVNALTHRAAPLGPMIVQGLSRKAYVAGVGWSHAGLAGLLNACGIEASARTLADIRTLVGVLKDGGRAILSVTPRLKGGERDSDGQLLPKAGHLVLAHGLITENQQVTGILISDPDHEGEVSRFRQPYGLRVIQASWGGRCIVC